MPTQLVLWRKPGATDAELSRWIDSVFPLHNLNIWLLCSECDNSLMLLSGHDVATFIQQGTVQGGTGSNPKTIVKGGGNGHIYYSTNCKMKTDDNLHPFNLSNDYYKSVYSSNALVNPKQPDSSIVVAIFDTGIDSGAFPTQVFYQSAIAGCMGTNDNNGWNFTGLPPNNDCEDDNNNIHGTVVSGFAVNEVDSLGSRNITLLPVKTHNSSGASDLYSVLCGFTYALNRQAKIINASFGYYAPYSSPLPNGQDTGAILLKEYIKYYLTANNILLIAAAGNDTSNTDPNKHNLDSVSFYPATLARDPELTNVFAVTTVNKTNGTVSPIQNFSNKVVDIGVNADFGADWSFQYPFQWPAGLPMHSIVGSSFATPVVTGKICAYYYQFKNAANGGLNLSKQNIINILIQKGQASNAPLLNGRVHNGIVIDKSKF